MELEKQKFPWLDAMEFELKEGLNGVSREKQVLIILLTIFSLSNLLEWNSIEFMEDI